MLKRKGFYSNILEEIEEWKKEGIITEEQTDILIKKYTSMIEIQKKIAPKRLIYVLSILGSLLVGTGVILFFAANWQYIPAFIKLLLIWGLISLCYYIGYILEFEKNYHKVGSSLLFLGAILFGAGIFLTAQIYNISGNFSNGLLFWAAGILPVAYFVRSIPILCLALLNLNLWIEFIWDEWFRQHQIYDFYDSINIFINFVLSFYLFGILVYSIGLVHSRFKNIIEFELPYKIIGSLGILGTSYILTFKFMYTYQDSYFQRDAGIVGEFPFLLILLVAIAIISSLYIIMTTVDKIKSYESYTLIGLSILGLILIFTEKSFHYAIIFNIILLIIVILMIIYGHITRQISFVNLGVAFFVLDFITRYFDFFYELLPRSLFFIIGGLILIIGGILLEKKRREIIEKMKLKEE